jgi:hypothetical protein
MLVRVRSVARGRGVMGGTFCGRVCRGGLLRASVPRHRSTPVSGKPTPELYISYSGEPGCQCRVMEAGMIPTPTVEILLALLRDRSVTLGSNVADENHLAEGPRVRFPWFCLRLLTALVREWRPHPTLQRS